MKILSSIQNVVNLELSAVNVSILNHLESDVVLIKQIGEYIIQSGGKRLRPLAVLLSSRACGYTGHQNIDLAVIIELIHTATLLHDDVVDASEKRRNQETANAVWGNEASVLVGDFLYSKAFEIMSKIGSMRIMEVFAHATNRIAEGEVLQLLNCHNPDISEANYFEIIERKTATLFAAGTYSSTMLASVPSAKEIAIRDYGLHLGIAFQLIDDVLDYSPNNPELGKNVGDDLAEGKVTLPLIQALATCTKSQTAVIRAAIENGSRDKLNDILATLETTKSIDYTIAKARKEAELAKFALRDFESSAYIQAMYDLADFAVNRNF
jgi:octaprenyl-diphosphate synthase